jgi:hypothetical protein
MTVPVCSKRKWDGSDKSWGRVGDIERYLSVDHSDHRQSNVAPPPLLGIIYTHLVWEEAKMEFSWFWSPRVVKVLAYADAVMAFTVFYLILIPIKVT